MKRIITLLCLSALIAMAQIGTSTITGRVTDAAGATVPNVTVRVIQKSTNFTNTATTNTDGIYRVLSLQPGEYRVSFEAAGFKKGVNDEVTLRTGDTLAIDMAMQVGQLTESVEVTGSAQALETAPRSGGERRRDYNRAPRGSRCSARCSARQRETGTWEHARQDPVDGRLGEVFYR